MKIKILLGICIALIVISLSGCYFFNRSPLPTYERELNEQDGVAVMIDGVKYKALPRLKWTEQRAGDIFGKAGGKNLYLCQNDPERNFIFIWDEEYHPSDELHYVLLYRTDKEIPPPSADSVDEILLTEYDFDSSEKIIKYVEIYDKGIIKAFFDELDANQNTRIQDFESFKDDYTTVRCYSNEVPGARYYLWFGHVNGKLVCGNYFEGFVEFSVEVLEQIAEHEIDLEELLAEE